MAESYPWSHGKLKAREDQTDYLEEVRFPTQGKKRFKCKKLKGEHDMRLVSEEVSKWYPSPGKTIIREYRCKACNKKDIQFDFNSRG